MSAVSLTLKPLATLTPASQSRSWQTAPHPYLPLVATASSDKIVRVYSLTTFTQQSQITGGHKRSVRAVAWKPGLPSDPESILATGSFDATAGIWKGENRKRRIGGAFLSRTHNAGLDEEGLGTGFDKDDADEPLDSGDEDDYAYAVQLEGHDSEIKSLTWSPHGTFLATCSRDKSVWIWETLPDEDDNLETVAVLQEHEGDVKCVAWHPSDEGCLASGSYDENVRVWREDVEGEWTCVGLGEGHEGTVWHVCWEPVSHQQRITRVLQGNDGRDGEANTHEELNGVKPADDETPMSGPRIMSCSDDLTIRLWRRRPKPPRKQPEGPRVPSIIRSTSDEEDWYEEQRLPKVHDRAIYAVNWSGSTGRVVSCGSDGKIVVYEENAKAPAAIAQDVALAGTNDVDVRMTNGNNTNGETAKFDQSLLDELKSEWRAVATLEAAHGVFEVNHVCWARRHDNANRQTDEEVIVSSGDDGEVKVWTLDDWQQPWDS